MEEGEGVKVKYSRYINRVSGDSTQYLGQHITSSNSKMAHRYSLDVFVPSL